MNDYIIAVILGIVEGLTEFLPVSSTGHLIIVNSFLGFENDADFAFANRFNFIIQLGAIFSVVIYFWNRLQPFAKSDSEKSKIFSIWKRAMVGFIPAAILGYLLNDFMDEHLLNIQVVAAMLFIGGVALIILERRKSKEATFTETDKLPYRTALWIGLFQCLAMVPGTSRSAATIIGAMLLGSSRTLAAEFSFFLALPTMVAASGYSIFKPYIKGFINSLKGKEEVAQTLAPLTTHQMIVTAIGFVVSFFVAWGVISIFMKFIQSRDFGVFGWYRVVLSVILIASFFMGVIDINPSL